MSSNPKFKPAWQDLVWLLLLAVILVLMLVSPMAAAYQAINAAYPYPTAFLKFMVLAPMGEMLATRIRTSKWIKPTHLLGRALVWGFLGMVIALAFQLFSGGVAAAAANGFLPKTGSRLLNAFMISAIMNILFAPGMMAFHRFTDTWFDLKAGGIQKPTVGAVAAAIQWDTFVGFVVLKTIPLFWIPAHTITFLLPGEYRVFMAAMLSMALGLLLAFAKSRPAQIAKNS